MKHPVVNFLPRNLEVASLVANKLIVILQQFGSFNVFGEIQIEPMVAVEN